MTRHFREPEDKRNTAINRYPSSIAYLIIGLFTCQKERIKEKLGVLSISSTSRTRCVVALLRTIRVMTFLPRQNSVLYVSTRFRNRTIPTNSTRFLLRTWDRNPVLNSKANTTNDANRPSEPTGHGDGNGRGKKQRSYKRRRISNR